MAQDFSAAGVVGRNHRIYTLLDQLIELEGKGLMYMLFFGFQVPDQCHTEELSHPFSPTVAPLAHNQQYKVPSSRWGRHWQIRWLACLLCPPLSASRY